MYSLNIKEGIATLTIEREEKFNALNIELMQKLITELQSLGTSKLPLLGLIIEGAGEKAFVAGADIAPMRGYNGADGAALGEVGQKLTNTVESLPFPTIAAIDGFALGGGCELALACDFIFATEKSKLGQPEVKLGLIPGFGGCYRLKERIGLSKAKELIYSGRIVLAEEALKIGLVDHLFDTRTTMRQTAIDRLHAYHEVSGHAIAIAKSVLNGMQSRSATDSLAIENKGYHDVFEHAESAEGIEAFLQKRAPSFDRKFDRSSTEGTSVVL